MSGISVVFDQATNTLPSGFVNDVNAVVAYFESAFNDTIDLTLHVGYGEVNGTTLNAGSLGQSNWNANSFTYSQLKTALTNDATDSSDSTAVASLPASDPISGTHTYWVTQAEQEALGLLSSGTAINGYVGFSNTFTFDYDRSNGIASGAYDFIGTVAHEITEVLGRQVGVQENDVNNAPSDFISDLFHFSSSGVRDFSRGGYLSANNGATNLGDLSTSASGDAGDLGGSVTNNSFLSFSNPGVYNDITPSDLTWMDILGYNYSGDDFAANSNFSGEVAVDGSSSGNIETSGDHDWFRVFLNAGQSYRIEENGSSLTDPLLHLYDSSSNQVGFDDDSFNGATFSLNSRLFYTPSTSGYYYVDAGAFSTNLGTYTASVTADDYDAGIRTTGAVALGSSATGRIETSGDHDWFQVTLTAGVNYLFRESGSAHGLGSLSDTVMTLYNSAGTLVTSNDDSRGTLDSQIIYTPTSSGTYYIDAAAFASHTGTYTVSASVLPAPLDTNGNGYSDVVWRSSAGTLVNWSMNGTQISSSDIINATPDSSWSIAGNGDFNGDSHADLLWRQTSTGSLVEWGMNGAQISSSNLINAAPDASWNVAAVGDFNGDGKSDILWRQGSGGTLAEWLMNGAQISSSNVINATPDPSWSVAAVGDFNGDGRSDIVWRNGGTGALAEWQMNGNQISSSLLGAAPDSSWHVAGIGDFNGDGNADMLWRQDSSNTLVEWQMRGSNIVSSAILGASPDASWNIVEIGDFNSDNMSDLLWRQGSSGTLVDWQMNGTQITSNTVNAAPDATWHVQANPNNLSITG